MDQQFVKFDRGIDDILVKLGKLVLLLSNPQLTRSRPGRTPIRRATT